VLGADAGGDGAGEPVEDRAAGASPARLDAGVQGNLGVVTTPPTPEGRPTGAVKRENGELELEHASRSGRERARARRLEQHNEESTAPTDPATTRPAPATDTREQAGS
jgi:hypothetical protein